MFRRKNSPDTHDHDAIYDYIRKNNEATWKRIRELEDAVIELEIKAGIRLDLRLDDEDYDDYDES